MLRQMVQACVVRPACCVWYLKGVWALYTEGGAVAGFWEGCRVPDRLLLCSGGSAGANLSPVSLLFGFWLIASLLLSPASILLLPFLCLAP